MATLQSIRNRGVLLMVIIGLALAAFILGDFLKSGKGNSTDIASIAGNDILYTDFSQKLNELTEIYKMNAQSTSLDAETTEQVRENVWNNLVRENVMMDSYEDLGIAISNEEMFDMVQGDNPHQIVRQLFGNPETGGVDKAMILQFLKSLDQNEQGKAWWLYMEQEIMNRRKMEKYNSLISKGLYINSKEAEKVVNGKKVTRNIEFFGKTFSSLNDSTITASDAEIKTYYNAHKDLYKQEEGRDIEYISFPIAASDEDNLAVKEWITKVKPEVEKMNHVKELTQFVKLNSDDTWNGLFIPLASVGDRLTDFASNEAVGSVYGPYFENEKYKLVKLAAKEMRPDSVKVSHIMLQEATPERTAALADSVYKVVSANSKKLTELALQFSKDTESSVNGGDLGWFEEGEVFAECFENKRGSVLKLSSPSGIHVVYVEKVSKKSEKVQLATITRKVDPSTDTYRNIYSEASRFVGENNTVDKFQQGVKTEGFVVQQGADLKKNQRALAGIENSRDAIRWAYEAEIGELSNIFEYDDQFIIAVLVKIKEEGVRSVADVSELIKPEVIKEKKSAKFVADIEAAKEGSESLSSLAQKMGETVKPADNIGFNSFFVPGAGYEPALVGAILVADKEQISAPIAGMQGVYVFRVLSETETEDQSTVESEKLSLAQSYIYRIMQYDEPFTALKKQVKIEDNRSVFF